MTTDSYVLFSKTLDYIHSHSSYNVEEIKASTTCCCFYCKKKMRASEVVSFVDKGHTALCPYCGIDSVLGDASDIPITPALIGQMHDFWFERGVLPRDFDYSWFEPVKE